MIYTAIVGSIDPDRSDIKCFRDPTWFLSQRMAARQYKIMSHLWIIEDVSIWVDGNIKVKAPADELLQVFISGDVEVGCFAHPYRKNPVEEIEECIAVEKERRWRLDAFTRHYGVEQLVQYPLYETGVLIRRHAPNVRRMNALWWESCTRWTQRDQITFPLAVKESGVKILAIDGNVRNHPMFEYSTHE